MNQETEVQKCQWCGRKLDDNARSERRTFCRQICRKKYQIAKRKIEREKFKAMVSLWYVQDMLSKSGELQKQAIEANQLIQDMASILTGYEISCGSCGKRVYIAPASSQRCDCCGLVNWKYKAT